MSLRPVKQIIQPKATIEGAGVKLQRAFGFGKTKDFDPFLLLDDFRNDNPDDYLAGFPWHPHRGIETITYVLAGSVEHGDSLGNKGKMTAGDVQWMTAGSGILHQEMPKGLCSRIWRAAFNCGWVSSCVTGGCGMVTFRVVCCHSKSLEPNWFAWKLNIFSVGRLT